MSRDNAIEWARHMLDVPGTLILDTETTGLDDQAEVIQIGVIDITGAVVLDLLIKPRRAIPADATRIHGITNTMVSNCPTWVHVQKSIMDALQWHNIVIYNADYDLRVIHQTDKGWAVQDSLLSIQSAYCAMLNYAAFVGEWNEYRGSFRWQKLSGGDHSALGDCRATLDLIKRMAAAKMSYESDTVI